LVAIQGFEPRTCGL